MSQTTSLTLPGIQAALRLAGLPPARSSPFADLSPPTGIDQGVLSTLRGKNVVNGQGEVTDAWREVLATLASPGYRVWLYLGSADRWEAIDYYSRAGDLIGYASTGTEHLVTFPCSIDTLSEGLGRWLGWHEMPDGPQFEADLDAQELVALASVVDAHREESVRAFLDRRQPDVSRFTHDQLVYELETGAHTGDPRWLVGILQRHAPTSFQPSASSLDGGAAALAARGWLTLDGTDAVVSRDLAAIAAAMGVVNPYAVLSVAPMDADGSLMLTMRAMQSFWTVDFFADQNQQAWVRLQGLGGAELRSHVREALAILPKPAPDPAAWTAPLEMPVPVPPVTAHAPPVHAPAARESRPTLSTTSRERTCTKCGKPLLPGRKFCTGCGTPVG
jgi:hypothetical protein